MAEAAPARGQNIARNPESDFATAVAIARSPEAAAPRGGLGHSAPQGDNRRPIRGDLPDPPPPGRSHPHRAARRTRSDWQQFADDLAAGTRAHLRPCNGRRNKRRQPLWTRAIAELIAVSRFADWNPDHFLDTAELCLAVSIGYDWLHHQLSSEQREEIATALLQKGIEPSLETAAPSNWWLTTDENWAQVCHGGLSAAVIVLADRNVELAEFVLTRAIAAIPSVAASYAPDGAYPEGPMYWSYGTGYHVVLAAALESLTGSAQGLDEFTGFAESAEYINAMTAPSGEYFNYADCAARRRLQAQMFWMADRYGRPDWLTHDLATLERDLEEYRASPSDQYWYYDMVALALLWRQPVAAELPTPQPFWSGGGRMPVATYRWGQNFFLGVKGGSVGQSHSHMDVGSFVFEAGGERWAVDTGMQDYAGLEAAGVGSLE